ncbi:MAG: DUF6494 family protein [Gemmatimonadetes bacterium]|nr:DUF6494 family protein [Gemmatimonadota bacterium]
MDDDAFNLSVRRFLKTFGVTAQREIERAIREGMKSGRITGTETLRARATVRIGEVGLEQTIEGDIQLA